MNSFYALFFCSVLTVIGLSGCRKSGVACGSPAFGLAIQEELNTLSTASTAYYQNPTPANCEAYKKAYVDYIDAIRGWEKCLSNTAERNSWQQSLDEAEQEANDLQC
jgi:hypothetical protein